MAPTAHLADCARFGSPPVPYFGDPDINPPDHNLR